MECFNWLLKLSEFALHFDFIYICISIFSNCETCVSINVQYTKLYPGCFLSDVFCISRPSIYSENKVPQQISFRHVKEIGFRFVMISFPLSLFEVLWLSIYLFFIPENSAQIFNKYCNWGNISVYFFLKIQHNSLTNTIVGPIFM